MISKKFKVAILILLFLFNANLFAQQNNQLERADSLLEEIVDYVYGSDRQPLAEFKVLVASVLNDDNIVTSLEESILKSLSGKCTIDGKRFLTEQLSLFGSELSVPLLIDMVEDQDTRAMSLYALGRMATKQVDAKLLSLLNEVDAGTKIAILNVLAFRKSQSAIDEIAEYVDNENNDVSEAAISALGKIGTEKSGIILNDFINNSEIQNKEKLFSAYLDCAYSLNKTGNKVSAHNIYQTVLDKSEITSQKSAAIEGLINTAGDKKGEIIFEFLSSGEKSKIDIAAMNLYQLIGDPVIDRIRDNLLGLNEYAQLIILTKAAEYKIDSFHSIAKMVISKGTDPVKIAAVKLIQSIGNSDDVSYLISLTKNENSLIADEARNSIYNLSGDMVDNEIKLLIKTTDNHGKIELIKAVGIRKIYSAFSEVITTANNEDIQVRLAAYETLAEIGTPKDLDLLIQVFLAIENDAEIKRFESTLAKVALRNPGEEKRALQFLEVLEEQVDNIHKHSLVRILGATGDPNAYSKIEEFLNSDDEEIQKAAIQSLYNWPNLEPLDQLMQIVEESSNKTHQILALRGYINLLKAHGPEIRNEVVDLYAKAFEVSKNQTEKTMILSGLSQIQTAEAAKFVAQFLDEESLKAEAELALLNILEEVVWDEPEIAKEILMQMKKAPSSEDVNNSIDQLLNILTI